MNTLQLIHKYFPKDSVSRYYYLNHVESVTKFALEICDRHPEFHADRKLVEDSSMLHDIGICQVDAPDIGCEGDQPYICHGILGAEIVMQEWNNLQIARICETHVGIGITVKDIETQKLPLQKRDMIPISIEEQIVCFADKFFSKSPKNLTVPKNVNEIREKLLKFGNDKIFIFDEWVKRFGIPSVL